MFDLPPRLTNRASTLELRPTALAAICTEAWNNWPNETGGILLGKTTRHGAQVTAVVGPGPHARHERYNFTPDADWQASQVAALWRQDRSLEYLGDWHTHPAGTTKASRLDIETAQTIADHQAARQPEPFMLVAALRRDTTIRLGAAQYRQGRLRRASLQVQSSQEHAARHQTQ